VFKALPITPTREISADILPHIEKVRKRSVLSVEVFLVLVLQRRQLCVVELYISPSLSAMLLQYYTISHVVLKDK